MEIKIRIAVAEDAELLSRLGSDTFYETWRDYNTEEDMRTYLQESFPAEKLKHDLENDTVNTFLLVMADGDTVGYAKLRRDRSYAEFGNSRVIEVERVYVKRNYQGMKLGKALMDECLVIGTRENFEWIWLGVNIDNVKAITFYEQYGFIKFGTKHFKLGNADDLDYLMKLKL